METEKSAKADVGVPAAACMKDVVPTPSSSAAESPMLGGNPKAGRLAPEHGAKEAIMKSLMNKARVALESANKALNEIEREMEKK